MRSGIKTEVNNFCNLLRQVNKSFHYFLFLFVCTCPSFPVVADDQLSFEQARTRVIFARERVKIIEKEYSIVSKDEIAALRKLEEAKKNLALVKKNHEEIRQSRIEKKIELEKAKELLQTNRRIFKKIRTGDGN